MAHHALGSDDINELHSRAEILRSLAFEENQQINRRLSWLGSFQGFLLAALAFAWGKSEDLVKMFCLLGVAVSFLILIGLVAAVWGLKSIHDQWSDVRRDGYTGPNICGFYPNRHKLTLYTSPELLLPVVFGAAWCCVYVLIPSMTVNRTP